MNAGGVLVNNERLEFLGDAIFDAVISDYIYTTYREKDEGFLSKLRAKIVNREFLNALAVKMELDRFIISQENQNAHVVYKNISGNVFEALIGACYLDKGYNRTKKFVLDRLFQRYIDLKNIEKSEKDFKSQILEYCQKQKVNIAYETEEGLNVHDNLPLFTSTIYVNDEEVGRGMGNAKKEAEQDAAKNALNQITGNGIST